MIDGASPECTTQDTLLPEWAEDEKCLREDPMNDWKQVSGRRRGGPAERRQPSPDPVTRRKIPDLSTYAKPLLSDLRYSWITDGGRERTVFYPSEIPIEEIRRAMSTPEDWNVVHPT